MKIYILTSHYGEYEDSWSNVEGVYSDPRKAEEAKDRLASEIRSMADIPCPVDEDDEDNWSDIDYDKWGLWNNNRSAESDFKYCNVKEFEVIV